MEQITNDENFLRAQELEVLEKSPLSPFEEDIPKNSDELLKSQAHFIDLSGKITLS